MPASPQPPCLSWGPCCPPEAHPQASQPTGMKAPGSRCWRLARTAAAAGLAPGARSCKSSSLPPWRMRWGDGSPRDPGLLPHREQISLTAPGSHTLPPAHPPAPPLRHQPHPVSLASPPSTTRRLLPSFYPLSSLHLEGLPVNTHSPAPTSAYSSVKTQHHCPLLQGVPLMLACQGWPWCPESHA